MKKVQHFQTYFWFKMFWNYFLVNNSSKVKSFISSLVKSIVSITLANSKLTMEKADSVNSLLVFQMFRTLKVCSQFIALDENKADLAKFLSEAIVEKGKDLPERYEIVIGGGFIDATDARSMMRDNVRHQGNHEEADTKLILHSSEAVSEGYQRVLVICRDTDAASAALHNVRKRRKYGWSLEWQRSVNLIHYRQHQRDLHNLWGTTYSASMH